MNNYELDVPFTNTLGQTVCVVKEFDIGDVPHVVYQINHSPLIIAETTDSFTRKKLTVKPKEEYVKLYDLIGEARQGREKIYVVPVGDEYEVNSSTSKIPCIALIVFDGIPTNRQRNPVMLECYSGGRLLKSDMRKIYE
jgi:hypothetical protein